MSETLKEKQSRVGKSNVSRSKGHERTVAKFLTEWSGREFRRRRVEGRDATVIERESTADVIAVRDDIYCSIEAKCGEVSLAAVLSNPAGTRLTEWWHQACYDVSLLVRVMKRQFYPMVFFRPFSGQNWIATSADLFKILKQRSSPYSAMRQSDCTQCSQSAIWFPHFMFDAYRHIGDVSCNVKHTKKKANQQLVPLQLPAMVLCRWSDFALNVDPDSFFVAKPEPVKCEDIVPTN